ncbi:MAG: lipid-binding protein [Flavobacteriaceae bacterium]|nr:lipid-binding protein [Flavobacteriaceae bacterium]|tara:strand:- start:54 stop:617 length:564 start_codon:yes stop_codon:yes gene_type:complete
MKHIKLLFALLFSFSVYSQRDVNIVESTIKWTGKEISTKYHYGSLKFLDAKMEFDGSILKSGQFIVDMTSLTVDDLSGRGKQNLEGHLRSDDFFSIDKFSEATLETTDASRLNDGKYTLNGNLTIKGITNPIQFEIIPNSNLVYEAKMIFDRSKYNVRFRSGTFFQNLGDKLILDDIEIIATIVLKD